MEIDLLVIGILVASPIALWGALCALNSILRPATRPSVAFSFLLIAWGWGAVAFAAIDYLVHGSPMFWPRLLLFGVFLLAVGNGVLHLANRRDCRCLGCPGEISLHDHRPAPPEKLPGRPT